MLSSRLLLSVPAKAVLRPSTIIDVPAAPGRAYM
jgi:hypothetical protein